MTKGVLTGSTTRKIDFYLLLVGFIGFFVAYYRFGWEVLNPLNINWLMADGDSITHFLGWHFFRSELWQFPPGYIKGYWAPEGTSIGYTDSLPLLALPFKFISSLLSDDFQYFGIWLFVCHVLQAIFGYLLVGTVSQHRLTHVLGGLFFLISPVMIIRNGHIALSSHWLILAALWIYVITLNKFKIKKYFAYWSLLVGISSFVHPYINIMINSLAIASILRDLMITRELKIKDACMLTICLAAISIFSFWLIGFFSLGRIGWASGFGDFSINLNAIFNACSTSRWLPSLPTHGRFQCYEGYAYLGLGMIVLVGIAFIFSIKGLLHSKNDKQQRPLQILLLHLPLLFVCLGFFLFALSNHITLGDKMLLSFDLGKGLLHKVSGVLRGSGRFFWPVYYVMFFLVLMKVMQSLSATKAFLVLAVCLVLQVTDLNSLRPIMHDHAYKFPKYLKDPDWSNVIQPFDMIVPIPPYFDSYHHPNDYKEFSYLAANHGKKIATGYVARHSSFRLLIKRLTDQLLSQEPDTKSLYVFTERTLDNYLDDLSERITCFKLDDYIVCHKQNQDLIFNRELETKRYKFETKRLTLLEYLQQYKNEIIILSAKGEASEALTEQFMTYMSAHGSQIQQLGYQDSYGAVFYRGYMIYEKFSNEIPIELQWPAGTTLKHPAGNLKFTKDVKLFSAGLHLGNNANILIDGKLMSTNGRGLNIIILNNQFEMISRAHFDTHRTDTATVRRNRDQEGSTEKE